MSTYTMVACAGSSTAWCLVESTRNVWFGGNKGQGRSISAAGESIFGGVRNFYPGRDPRTDVADPCWPFG
jgi:hypothetical protein